MLLKAMVNSKHRTTFIQQLGRLDVEKETLVEELIKVSRLAGLNAVEIIHWSLLLDNYGWEESGVNYKKFLRITALQIKVRPLSPIELPQQKDRHGINLRQPYEVL
eukprot:TRINITY_DN6173_c0_g2_i2.p2 TRINITY_DN6173_c0_g2~~TRINITY_DN6173_c0_g2_i2.p2  ORF type:complete len:106 (+),score=6.04 TRINITY_DN6173_c0_g2_i2:444-761(+)